MRFLREPLMHFLLLGAALFVVFDLVGKRTGEEPQKIVVTQGRIEHLAAGFTRTWQRPPSAEELEGLVRNYIREEALCREATALGLDRDDAVIRRRLGQKMEFISDDAAAQVEPSDEELRAYMIEHPETFGIEPRFTFNQVYLNPDRRGEKLVRDAEHLLTRLQQTDGSIDAAAQGDPFLLDHRFDAVSAGEITRTFGEKFAAALDKLYPGQWRGPVPSEYGVHLVFVSERIEGGVPSLEEAREAVRLEWANTRRLEAREKFYQGLLQRYTAVVEWPKAAGEATSPVAHANSGSEVR